MQKIKEVFLPALSKHHFLLVMVLIVALVVQLLVPRAFVLLAAEVPGNNVKTELTPFKVTGAVAINGLSQSGPGRVRNGSISDYPEGSCIPIILTVDHNDSEIGDITMSPSYDYMNSDGVTVGIENLEGITSNLADPNDATDLSHFSYTGSSLSSISSFPTSAGGTVSATISGPYAGGDDSSTPISALDQERHYNIVLLDVEPDTEVYITFCARISVDASEYNGASMSIRVDQAGAENIGISPSQLLALPNLTLQKVVSSGELNPDQWSFEVTPSINGQSVYDIPDGADSVTINNVTPDGEYSIVEVGPAGYAFVGGSGTNCLFDGSTATATLATGDPATDATCIFENAAGEASITVTKVVVNDNGGSATVEDFPLFIDATGVTSGDTTVLNPGNYSVTETNLPGYSATYSGDCDSNGNITLGENENLTCTITNDDEQASVTVIKQVINDDGGTSLAEDFTMRIMRDTTELASFPGDTSGTTVLVDAGLFSVTENAPGPYSMSTSGTCSGALLPGESVTCTITNDDQQASITVTKVVVNDNGGTALVQDFDLFVDGTPMTSGVSSAFTPGNYSVSETNLPGYTASYSGDCDSNGNLTLGLGESLNCTITNDDVSSYITVEKVVVNDDGGSSVVGDFSLFVDGTPVNSGDTNEFAPGVLSISETNLPGYVASYSGDCDANGNLTLGLGESLTCTITNDDQASSITVNKVVINDNGGSSVVGDFPLFIDNTQVTSGNSNALAPGAYTVSETNLPGYIASYSGDCDVNGNMTLGQGENLTCTITNNDGQAALTVTKVVVNDNGGSAVVGDFPLFIDATQVTSGASNSLAPGVYSVSETNLAGYTASYSGDCDSEGNVTLGTGESLNCTITNNDQQATLTVVKVVVNDDGGSATVQDFPLFIDATQVNSGDATDLNPGTYNVSETNLAGYTASYSGDCDSNGSVTLGTGENLTCTITNDDQQAIITVNKVVVNDNGGLAVVSDFPLFVDNTQVTSGVSAAYQPGVYTVSETNLPGYTASYSGDCDENGVIAVSVGESVTCTITNDDQQASVTVIKEVINDEGGTSVAGDFTINVMRGETPLASFAGNANGTTVQVDAGDFNVDETQLAGLYTMSLSGECSGTLVPGGSVTCTVTNDDVYQPPPTGTLTIVTVVVNDEGGSADSSDFPAFVDSEPVLSGTQNVVDPADYAVSGTDTPGYDSSISGDCSDIGSVTVDAGEDMTCTITYDDVPSYITVTKVVINNSGGTLQVEDFDLFVDDVQVTSGEETYFAPGSYTVSEENADGYRASFSGDCDSEGNITVGHGESATCTITNDDRYVNTSGRTGGCGLRCVDDDDDDDPTPPPTEEEAPTPQVLSEVDEVVPTDDVAGPVAPTEPTESDPTDSEPADSEDTEQPEPRVLSTVDELPITGIPGIILIIFLPLILWALRRKT